MGRRRRRRGSWITFFACGSGGGSGGASSDEEAAAEGGLAAPEKKASLDKSRWSFRKSSGRHPVLSKTVTSDPVSIEHNKKSPENAVQIFQSPVNSSVPEKNHIEESPLSSSTLNLELDDPLVTGTHCSIASDKFEDSVAVVIQASIRGYLARRDLLKLKNVVKLQAALRGHLVRRQALGTFRCIQAIIKMQTLVRARQSRKYVKEFAVAKDDENLQTDTGRTIPLGNGYSSIQPNESCPSTEKLLSNLFARQLLELTPKTAHIPIKCDPSKSDSAWKWLERWMAVTSPDERQQQEQNFHQGHHENEENGNLSADGVPEEVPVTYVSLSSDINLSRDESAFQAEGEEDDDSLTVLMKSHEDRPGNTADSIDMPPGNTFLTERVTEIASESFSCQIAKQYNATAEPPYISIFDKHEKSRRTYKRAYSEPLDNEGKGDLFSSKNLSSPVSISDKDASHGKSRLTFRRAYSEALDNEGKGDLFSSRNPSSPMFAAIQSKFEALASTSSVSRSNNPAYQGASAEAKSVGPSPMIDSFTETKDVDSVEDIIVHDPTQAEDTLVHDPIQVATSECGTEVSFSSVLNSPDRFEGGEGIVFEIGSLGIDSSVVSDASANAPDILNEDPDREDSSVASASFPNIVNENAETKDSSIDSQIFEHENPVEGEGCVANSILVADTPQVDQTLEELTTSDRQTQIEISVNPRVHKPSPEGSPGSQRTVLLHESLAECDGHPTNTSLSADTPQIHQQLEELTTSERQSQIEILTEPQVYRSSPEGTPGRQRTVLESHALLSECLVECDGRLTNSSLASDTPQVHEQREKLPASEKQSQIEISTEPRVHRSSPEGTPESQRTALDSHVLLHESSVECDGRLTNSSLVSDTSQVDQHLEELTKLDSESQVEISGDPRVHRLSPEGTPVSQRSVLQSLVLVHDGGVNSSVPAADASQVDQQLEEITSDIQNQREISVDPRMYRSSPEGTPGSQKTVPELRETPSSQVSVNAKAGQKDDSRKQRLQLQSKSSPSTPYNDSKSGKRRNSFGMAKSDHVDAGHRISSSEDPLPGYMRATESARAKAHASISLKSSSDVQDNSYLKRHSFPIANEIHGPFPRIQRSASQPRQTRKGNDTHSPHNSAERRWQR